MSLDGQSKRFLELASSNLVVPYTQEDIKRIRAADEERNPVDPYLRSSIESVDDLEIDGPNGPIALRVYRPQQTIDPPIVVYIHGGGFCISSLDVYDYFCCLLCSQSAAIIVSVGYRLAPEHKFPAGLLDTSTAYRWVVANRSALHSASNRIALAGDSAGAGLAAGVMLLAKRDGFKQPDFQVLIYPMLAGDLDTPSRSRLAEGHFVTREIIAQYMKHYVSSEQQFHDPLVAPILAEDLSGLPPALVITAQYDPLRDEGADFARKLSAAGVDVIYTDYGGTLHAFMKRPGRIAKGLAATAQAAAIIRSALSRGWHEVA